MSIEGLYNVNCSWIRKSNDGSRNEFGERVFTEITLASDIRCRIEKIADRELIEAYIGGDTDVSLYVLYLPVKIKDSNGESVNTDIRANDIVEVDGFMSDMTPVSSEGNKLIVIDVEDAAGGQRHHLEVFCKYRRGID